MTVWNPQHYRQIGERKGVPAAVLDAAVDIIRRVQKTDARMAPVLTLRHLSELTGVEYWFLRRAVSRELSQPYRTFTLKKKVPGRTGVRIIRVPDDKLAAVQHWIVGNILRFTTAHDASAAYHPGSRPEFAAKQHCGCDYLLKVDIEDFFHRVTEGKVYRIFRSLGYPSLISFELARLTTAQGEEGGSVTPTGKWSAIPIYRNATEGFLPQGAPTSPMLSNLAMRDLDTRFAALADRHKLKYTRYADDLVFSGKAPYTTMTSMKVFKNKVIFALREAGFQPNFRKTQIRGPGARRIVLGILVDSEIPRLPGEFKDNIRRHLHYLTSPQYGPAQHANATKTSQSTLYNHLLGLIAWAIRVEPDYGNRCLGTFRTIAWPPIDRLRIAPTDATDAGDEL